jgi:hypothetical protein
MDTFSIEGFPQASQQIQTVLFYEEAYLIMLVGLCRDTVPRSKKYLESLVSLIDVVFQLLEKNWSSENAMVVRKKTSAGIVGDQGQESDEDEEPQLMSSERLFSLKRFEYQFAFESVIDTYCALLEHYENLSEETLGYIVNMFNRICGTDQCDKESLLYQVLFE